MRIAHICLASAFTEGLGYQDNELVECNRADGHDVLVVSDCRHFIGAVICDTPEEDRSLSNGARLVRLPFFNLGSKFLTDKLKFCPKLYPLLESWEPEVIVYHGIVGFAMLDVARYKKSHPSVKLLFDSHEDKYNSGLNPVSLHIQHRLITRLIFKCCAKYAEKVLYISYETRDFIIEHLSIPEALLEFYPLGGTLVANDARILASRKVRESLSIQREAVVYLHSGKFDALKGTADIVEAFKAVNDPNAWLILVGSVPKDIAADLLPKFEHPRVYFLGWKSADELRQIMCASSVYLQPGPHQSASLQHAICTGLPVVVHPFPSHQPYVQGNGWFAKNVQDVSDIMREIAANPSMLERMRTESARIAAELLDYRALARRLTLT